jgi:hypothetical protein
LKQKQPGTINQSTWIQKDETEKSQDRSIQQLQSAIYGKHKWGWTSELSMRREPKGFDHDHIKKRQQSKEYPFMASFQLKNCKVGLVQKQQSM